MKKIFSAKTIVHAISKRFFAFMAASLLLGDKFFVTYAQSAGTSAINSAATELSAYAPSVKKLLYVIAGIIVLIGCFNVYYKMQNGDQDVKKTIMLAIGGCVAMVAMANALPKFFE